MHYLLSIYHALPPQFWAFFGGGSFLALFAEGLKRLLGVKSTLVIHVLTSTTAFLMTVIPVLINNQVIAQQVLGEYTGIFFVGANILYAAAKTTYPFWQKVSAYNLHKSEVKNGTAAELQPASASAEYDG